MISRSHDLGAQGANGCDYLEKGFCPLEIGKPVIFKIVDEIKSNEIRASGVKLTYKIFIDDTDDVLACFQLRVNVVDQD